MPRRPPGCRGPSVAGCGPRRAVRAVLRTPEVARAPERGTDDAFAVWRREITRGRELCAGLLRERIEGMTGA